MQLVIKISALVKTYLRNDTNIQTLMTFLFKNDLFSDKA